MDDLFDSMIDDLNSIMTLDIISDVFSSDEDDEKKQSEVLYDF